jgi:hypothetical protein
LLAARQISHPGQHLLLEAHRRQHLVCRTRICVSK